MNSIFIANLGKYEEGEIQGDWFQLGQPQEDLQIFLEKVVGINEEYRECFILDTNLNDFNINTLNYNNIYSTNEIFIYYEQLDSSKKKLIQAIIEAGYYGNSIDKALSNMDSYHLYRDINSEYDMGYAIVHEWGIFDTSNFEFLSNYIDYYALGNDIILSGKGIFTSKGLLMESSH